MHKDISTMRSVTKLLLLLCLLIAGRSALAQTTGTVTYVYTDPQGTPLAETDANGNITATFDYTPYGTYAPQGTSTPGPAPTGPGYTGHVNDPETNLVYMQARYYDSATGHFLSVDPIGSSPGNVYGFNRYSYVNNNPIGGIDPNGMQDCSNTCMFMRHLSDTFNDMSSAFNGSGGSPKRPLGQMQATTSAIQASAYKDLSTAAGAAAVATDPVLSAIPGGGLYVCSSAGCSGLGWTLAAIAVIPGEGLEAGEAAKGIEEIVEAARGDTTYLYQKVGSDGQHLKFGITKSPATRYTQRQLAGGELKILASGSKQSMLQLERDLHETLPIGPEEGQKFYIQKQVNSGLTPPPYGK